MLQGMDSGREPAVRTRGRLMRFVGYVMRRKEMENLSLTGRIPTKRQRQREKYMEGIA